MKRLLAVAALVIILVAHSDVCCAQWVPTNGPGTGPAVYAFAEIGNYLFAATDDGVFLSSHNGGTWSLPTPGLLSSFSGQPAQATAMVAQGSGLFTISYGTIYFSGDSGSNWIAVDSATFANTNTYAILLASNGTTLYVATEAASSFGDPGGEIYHSTDNGISWVSADTSFPDTAIYSLLAVGNAVFVGTWGGLYRSFDNGTSWVAPNSGLARDYIPSLGALGPIVFAETGKSGMIISIDGGVSWQKVDTGIPKIYANTFAASGTTIYAGTIDSGVYRSTDTGKSWSAANDGIANTDVQALLVAETNIFAGTYAGGCVFRSSDNGASWPLTIAGMASSGVSCLEVSEMNLIAGTGGTYNESDSSQFLTTDFGATWQVNTTNIEARNYIIEGGVIFAAGDAGVFKSTDSGSSWVLLSNGVPSDGFVSVAAIGTNLFA